MSLYQTSFRVRHECPYRDVSERFPDLTIREWPLSDCQVLEVTADAAPAAELREAVHDLGTVLHESADPDGLHVVLQSCRCSLEDSLIRRFEAHDCLYQPPTIYRHGWEHYTVLAFDEGDVEALLRDLRADRDVRVHSKTAVEGERVPHTMLAPHDQLFEGLTDRQLAALELALDAGYYEQPRGASLRELAGRTDVARSTFEEHLRKAENKLLTNAGRFLRLVSAGSGENPLRSVDDAVDAGTAD